VAGIPYRYNAARQAHAGKRHAMFRRQFQREENLHGLQWCDLFDRIKNQ
jgi:hypothetical protein